MAVAVRGVGAANGNSSATVNTSTTVTPNLPSGAALLDRVYILAVSTGTVATPTGWTLASTQVLGSGVAADTTGTRNQTVFYREYDGVWTMPLLTCAAIASFGPGIECATVALSKADGESWSAPGFGFGSDTTSGTGYSVTTGGMGDSNSAVDIIVWGWPGSPGTLSSPTLTATGCTFGSLTAQHALAGQSTGQDVWLATWTAPVTTGVVVAHVAGLTGTTANTAGAFVVSQNVTPALPSKVWNFDDGTQMSFNPGPNWTIANSGVRSVSSPDSLLCTRSNTTVGSGYTQGPFTPVLPNTRYSISAWVFASASTTYSFSVAGNMSTARLVNSNFTPAATTWQLVSCTVITGTTDTMVSVYITDDPNGAPTNASTISLDDVSVLLIPTEKLPANRARFRASLW